ncbi:MAG: hypothetical protein OXH34_01170 [Bacteroidetes bacterium]|nr:hypothetical protein [Bacteroidota bacterium]
MSPLGSKVLTLPKPVKKQMEAAYTARTYAKAKEIDRTDQLL